MRRGKYRRTIFCVLAIVFSIMMVTSILPNVAADNDNLGKIKKTGKNELSVTLCDCGCKYSKASSTFNTGGTVTGGSYSYPPGIATGASYSSPPKVVVKAIKAGTTEIDFKFNGIPFVVKVTVIPCPCKSSSMHGNSDEAPGAGGNTETPGGGRETPGQSGETPKDGAEPPGKSGTAPGKSGETPGKDGSAPGHKKKAVKKKRADDAEKLKEVLKKLKEISESPNTAPECADKIYDAMGYIEDAIDDLLTGGDPTGNLLEAILLLKYVADYGCPYLAGELLPIILVLTDIYFYYL